VAEVPGSIPGGPILKSDRMNDEQPQYALKQDIKRVLIPKILQLISLGAVFYFAIWLNLFLLEVEDSIKFYVTIGAIIVLVIAVILEIILLIQKTNKNKYLFYSAQVGFKGKEEINSKCKRPGYEIIISILFLFPYTIDINLILPG